MNTEQFYDYVFFLMLMAFAAGVFVGYFFRAPKRSNDLFSKGFSEGLYAAYQVVANVCPKPQCSHSLSIVDAFGKDERFMQLFNRRIRKKSV